MKMEMIPPFNPLYLYSLNSTPLKLVSKTCDEDLNVHNFLFINTEIRCFLYNLNCSMSKIPTKMQIYYLL